MLEEEESLSPSQTAQASTPPLFFRVGAAIKYCDGYAQVYCPFCGTPYEMSPDLKVLECENGSCKKVGAVRNTIFLPLAKGYLKL